MKKVLKNKSLLLLAALVSTNVFAASTYDMSFDLSSNDQPDAANPYFYCNVVDKAAIPFISPSKVNMNIADAPSGPIAFEGNAAQYTNISANDVKSKYFKVIKGGQQGKGTIRITINNNSDIDCVKGTGGRTVMYK